MGIRLPPKDHLEDINIPKDSPALQLLDEAVDHGNRIRRELHGDNAEVVEDVHKLLLEEEKQPSAQVMKAYHDFSFWHGRECRFRQRIFQPNL
ncbi:hypothetical protein AXF42_Ash018660 [Apostasia shenzhenica]|uniref:Uncharacterized protein n=1 Tax=Apostasia shenzhenica TaxID=1088818 RepID=A0A2I0B1L2_9ASPA|nr:hypothetical protein AXF42_Ash018660 [Apostasia shenzhenica]